MYIHTHTYVYIYIKAPRRGRRQAEHRRLLQEGRGGHEVGPAAGPEEPRRVSRARSGLVLLGAPAWFGRWAAPGRPGLAQVLNARSGGKPERNPVIPGLKKPSGSRKRSTCGAGLQMCSLSISDASKTENEGPFRLSFYLRCD